MFAASEANERYSTSALDLVTMCCFFEDQLTQLEKRKTHMPVVDRRIMGQPAQSASENPTKLREERVEISKPR